MTSTKILSTLGPASWDKIEAIYKTGVDGFRINMSHVKDYTQTEKLIQQIRAIAPSAFLVTDLEGPKIRLGNLESPLKIEKSNIINIAPQEDCPFGCVPIQVSHVYKHVIPGNKLLINDGLVGLEVLDIKNKIIKTKVIYGTLLESRKGVNIPDASIPMTFVSEKDKASIDFLTKHEIDYISASFTRSAADLQELKHYMNGSNTKIIAKIENHEGIKNFDEILEQTDGVMVARGDLGMEIGPVYVPENQKMMIKKCNRAGKMVITATQMLESMMTGMEPKRAEVSDIFNAVLDGTDVVMLSGETSVGQYPIETVKTMNDTLNRAEKYLKELGIAKKFANNILESHNNDLSNTLSKMVGAAAHLDNLGAIITPTTTGYTTQLISRFRTGIPIIALTKNQMLSRQLNAIWGVAAYFAPIERTNLVEQTLNYISSNNLLPKGTSVLITAGVGKYGKGTTNALQIETVR